MKIEKKYFNRRRALMIIHLVLVLLTPFLFTQMGGCQGEKETLPLNLGPEVSAEEIDEAISKPLASTDPVSIRLGEAFVVSETQELGGAAAFAVISDTSQTVVERQETATEVNIVVIEHKQKYVNGQVQKTSTEIPYRIEKAPAQPPVLGTAATSEISGKPLFRPEVMHIMNAIKNTRSPRELTKAIEMGVTSSASASASGEKVTFHGLKVTVGPEAPPKLVQEQENCLNIPGCLLTVHRVSFDMVFWENGKPDRVHWDLAMSDEAPFLAAMLNRCVTGLAELSGDQGSILVKQCLPVLNFRYGQ